MPLNLILLAAGAGTRMQSDLPKVLHEIAGLPLYAHALGSAHALSPERSVLVVGHGAASIRADAAARFDDLEIAVQQEQLGTAHAVLQARATMEGAAGDIVILYGDTPFIASATLETMAVARRSHDIVVLGFEARDPGRYGRLVMDGDRLERIVEFKDATTEERAITLCNSGVVMVSAATLFDLLDWVGNDNAAGEFYLTDIVGIAAKRGLSATAVTCPEAETLGVNSRAELARAEAVFQERARSAALDAGTTLVAPETVHFSHDTLLGRDTVVEPHVVFGPGVTVETGARVRAFSHLEGCHVGQGAVVGPYARLRPAAEIGNDARIGNFVEVKSARIGEGAKVNHLSYIGDAEIGEATNVGAGTITCNYDGVFKHETRIGARAFIGSNTMLVAPVTVGDGAMTASGSVVTADVPEGALAVARARQELKPGFATRFFQRLRALKAKRES